MISTSIDSVSTLALAKSVGSKDLKTARDEVPAGQYPIDIVLRLRGMIEVGEPYEQAIANKVPWGDLLAFVLEQLHPSTRTSLLKRFFEEGERGGDSEHVARLVKELVGTTRTECSGRIKPDLAVDVVTEATLAHTA